MNILEDDESEIKMQPCESLADFHERLVQTTRERAERVAQRRREAGAALVAAINAQHGGMEIDLRLLRAAKEMK